MGSVVPVVGITGRSLTVANQLKMATVSSIVTLANRGWSQRYIARTLGISRTTVRRHLAVTEADSNCTTNPPPGPPGGSNWSTNPPPGSNPPLGSAADPSAPGGHGPASSCEPYRQDIEVKLAAGFSGVRIWQDLVDEHGFPGSYDSVKRYLRRLGASRPLPFRRLESLPGEQAQVDLGTGPPIVPSEGKRRKTYVFRIILSHSRKGYSEVLFRQDTDSFLAALENAFWHFGGVPRTVVIDNLKAAVKHPDWFDPELNPKIQSFCEHYGTVILPTKPYTPRHKGKIERGIAYVQDNAIKGRRFATLAAANAHLLTWETAIADTRIHGTTRRQVGKVFEQVERAALLALPAGRFPAFREAQRSVHRDGHVEVAKAYYSVPPEYVGRRVWARWDGRVVRVYNRRMEGIATHVQQDPGRHSTDAGHIHDRKFSKVELGAEALLQQAARIGPSAARWGRHMLEQRGVAGLRVLIGLRALTHHYDSRQIDRACEIACGHELYRLRPIRELLKRGADQAGRQGQFTFLDEHEIIRDMDSYGEVVRRAMHEPLQEVRQRFGDPEGARRDDRRVIANGLAQAAAERPGPHPGRAAGRGGRRSAEPRGVPGADHSGRVAGAAGAADGTADETGGVPGESDTGKLRLLIQYLGAPQADL
jgi:transposase